MPSPRQVTYCSVTGIPEEFNEYLPKDSDEFKRWKAAKAGIDEAAAVEALSLTDQDGESAAVPVESTGPEKSAGDAAPAAATKKKKKAQVAEIVLERNTRRGKKTVTTITGLEGFGVKLNEAAKLFGKKFASGASVVKNPSLVEQIDVQGDFLDQAIELILKQYKDIKKRDIYYIDGKKKEPYFDEE